MRATFFRKARAHTLACARGSPTQNQAFYTTPFPCAASTFDFRSLLPKLIHFEHRHLVWMLSLRQKMRENVGVYASKIAAMERCFRPCLRSSKELARGKYSSTACTIFDSSESPIGYTNNYASAGKQDIAHGYVIFACDFYTTSTVLASGFTQVLQQRKCSIYGPAAGLLSHSKARVKETACENK